VDAESSTDYIQANLRKEFWQLIHVQSISHIWLGGSEIIGTLSVIFNNAMHIDVFVRLGGGGEVREE
jgi:hypothetical protein